MAMDISIDNVKSIPQFGFIGLNVTFWQAKYLRDFQSLNLAYQQVHGSLDLFHNFEVKKIEVN